MSVPAGRIFNTDLRLNVAPFRSETDPAFYFRATSHARAIDRVGKNLRHLKDIIVIAGKPGVGKTVVSRMIGESAAKSGILTAFINIIGGDDDGSLRASCPSLGFASPKLDAAKFLERIKRFVDDSNGKGVATLIIIDNAHQLNSATLTALLRQTMETHSSLAHRLVLVGAEALADRAQQATTEAKATFPVTVVEVTGLTDEETSEYLQYYLDGEAAPIHFNVEAAKRIHELTGGAPKLVNALSDRVTLRATLERVSEIDVALVNEVYGASLRVSNSDVEQNDVAKLLQSLGIASSNQTLFFSPDAANETEDDSVETTHATAIASAALEKPRTGSSRKIAAALVAGMVALAAPAYYLYQQTVAKKPTTSAVSTTPDAAYSMVNRQPPLSHAASEAKTPIVAKPAPKSTSSATAKDHPKADIPKRTASTTTADSHKPSSANKEIAKPALNKQTPANSAKTTPKPSPQTNTTPVAVAASKADVKGNTEKPTAAAKGASRNSPTPPQRAALTPTQKLESTPSPTPVKPAPVTANNTESSSSSTAGTANVAATANKADQTATSPESVGDGNNKRDEATITAPGTTDLAATSTAAASTTTISNGVEDDVGDAREQQRRQQTAALNALVERFTQTYKRGDIDAFMTLFQRNASTNESVNAEQIRHEYSRLFKLTERRRIAITNLSWSDVGQDTIQGSGNFAALVKLPDTAPQVYSGRLFIDVSKHNGEPLISALFHEYNGDGGGK